jgi:hypothetical protein
MSDIEVETLTFDDRQNKSIYNNIRNIKRIFVFIAICWIFLFKCNLYITFASMKYREVTTYKSYFEDFFKEQSSKVQDKIIKILDLIEQVERIPVTYLRYIEGTDGLFEVRVILNRNIFRVFCFFDDNRLIVLLSGFRRRRRRRLEKKLSAPSG